MDKEQFRLKREQFKQDMQRLSDDKSRRLFGKDEDRDAWVKVIRKSVEKEIEARVREALGTPPKERQRKRLEDRTAKRFAKIEEEKRTMATNIMNARNALERRTEEEEELLWLRRQKYLEKYNRRRTMRESAEALRLREEAFSTKTNDNTLISNTLTHSPIAWRTPDSVPSSFFARETQFKRPFITIQNSVEDEVEEDATAVEGPYFPSGRSPCMAAPHHIHSPPSFIEGLNLPDKNESAPKLTEHPYYPKCWRGSVIVFDTERKNTLDPQAVPPGCPPHLQFESRFECGNLRQAKRIGNYEYELVLNTDLYTKRHTQWYYFQLRKPVPGVTYTFTIINFLKKDSLYNHGMKPLFYSEKTAQEQRIGWTRRGHHIKYSQNYIKGHPLLSRDYIYYSLTFQMEFPYINDVCYLTHCYPYSYTDLEIYLKNIALDSLKRRYLAKQVLCKTIAGNNCYLLTITSEESSEEKLGVVITARVHPGETNASWMMKGLLDFLLSDHPVAENLRRKHVFKVVPMVNPDGVVVGNYRTNLAAKDLNRTYMTPNKETSPTVYHIKKLVESFSSKHEIVIYCDLHGHSRKPNVFMYGCTPNTRDGTTVKNFIHERLFPWLMSQKAPDLFSFRECKFKVRKSKESTARVVMWRQMGVTNSFTMEATFCGANFGDVAKGRHFHCGDFEAMGQHFCEVLMDYTAACPNGSKSEITEAFVEMASRMTQDIARHARLLQLNSNEPCCSADGRVRHVDDPRGADSRGEVNVFDVHVDDANSDVDFDEVQVSVRKSVGASLEDCFQQLEEFDLRDLCAESDSSDSDSDAESYNGGGNSKQDKREKKKKKKKKPMKRWEVLATLKQKSELSNEKEDQSSSKTPSETKKKKTRLNQGTFVNPYTSRFNNGIPMYSQERIEERLRKRIGQNDGDETDEELKQLPLLREDERDGMVTHDVSSTFPRDGDAPDVGLFRLTTQRDNPCYLVSRGPGTALVGKPRLGESSSLGFSVKIPGRTELPTRWDDEHSRSLSDAHEEILSYEHFWGEENPSLRNTVTLDPLQYPQSTAFAYDLGELSKTENELETAHPARKDWSRKRVEKSHSAPRLERIPNGPIHKPVLRSESKLRSLNRLRHLSLDIEPERTERTEPAYEKH